MNILFIVITFIASIFIGWTIGANDAANCVGAGIGSGRMTLRQGIVITCLFSFLGAVLLGSHVIKTVGKGIVPLHLLDKDIAMYIALAACFGAGLWVLVATLWGLPVSTSHSIVGAVAGAGLAFGAPVVWRKLLDIFICWLFTPIGAGVIAYLLYSPFKRVLFSLAPRAIVDKVITGAIFLTSIYLAFIWGANDVANATGVVVGAGIINSAQASVVGGIAILIGILTLGYKVIQTVGFSITRLVPLMAIVAELASAINVHIYTVLGIPVSTSHSIVGAVVGVGLIKGVKTINKKMIRDIIFAWCLTPFISGVVSYILFKVVFLLTKKGGI